MGNQRAASLREAYNMGGSRYSNCSMLKAISKCEKLTGKPFYAKYVDEHRRGDHFWWISDVSRFLQHYPDWKLQLDVPQISREIYEVNVEQWTEGAVGRHQSRPGGHGAVPAIY